MKFSRFFSSKTQAFSNQDLSTQLLKQLAKQPQVINLFEGIPNLPTPNFFKEALTKQLSLPYSHQYTRSYGLPELTNEIARVYSPFFERNLHSLNEVLVMGGSSTGIFSSIQAFVDPGDKVVYFEPSDQNYKEIVEFHKGKAFGLPLNSDNWSINLTQLEEFLSRNKVKLLILSSPQTPIGKIFSKQELTDLERILLLHPNLTILFDASFEKQILSPGSKVVGLTKEELWKRCVTLFSADRMFCSSGLNLSWAIGHSETLNRVKYIHNVGTFCLYKPTQIALKESLSIAEGKYGDEENYYAFVNKILRNNRDTLIKALQKKSIFEKCRQKFVAMGGYSMLFDCSEAKFADVENRDKMICMGLGVEREILLGPGSMYFSEENKKIGGRFLKVDFCKSEEEVRKVCEKMENKETIF